MLAIGIVLGFFLGGLAPRREVAERDERIARLERDLDAEGQSGGGFRSSVPGFDRILRDPAPIDRGVPLPGPEEEVTRADGTAESVELDEGGDGGVPPGGWRDRWADRASSPSEQLAAFQRAASVQRVRRLQSRAALAEQAELDDAELAQVDTALADMNAELLGHGEELVILAMSEQPPTARELLGITHDVTGILHRAQLRLETIVGPERASAIDPSAIEIWNHVDLAQLEPAARAAVQRLPAQRLP
jgi:hypothetical protein